MLAFGCWRHANQATPTHTAVRRVIAPTVRISNGEPVRASTPNARNTKIVAAAMISARRGAQRCAVSSPMDAANVGDESGNEVEPHDKGQVIARRLARRQAAKDHLAARIYGEKSEYQGEDSGAHQANRETFAFMSFLSKRRIQCSSLANKSAF